jgi:hypothetical protein
MRINDGQSHCRLADPSGSSVQAPVTEIGLQGAVLETQTQFETNAYIDITLVLKNLAPRQLFAHVVSSGNDGLRLRWLHFDPGEEGKLKSLLESYARAQNVKGVGAEAPASGSGAPGGASGTSGGRRAIKPRGEAGPDAPAAPAGENVSGTRRLVRPSATAITPFSDTPPASGESARIGTRRVLRPSQKAMTPFSDAPNAPAGPLPAPPKPANAPPGEESRSRLGIGEDSRTHQVVIETTDRFEKLIDVGIESGATAAVKPQAKQPPQGPPDQGPSAEPGEGSGGHALAPSEDTAPAQAGPSAPAAKTSIIGRDGRMDIGASIRSHAKTVRASELAARHDRVRVLNMGTIKTLIQEAVEEAAAHLTRSLNESERKRLLEEAEEGFQERLKAFQSEKEDAEIKTKRLSEQLESARRLLDEERKRTIKADQFTVSAEGLGEIEDRFQRLLSRSISEGGIAPQLEEELRKLIAHILDSERDKIRERELEAQNAKIALLEKKVGRLAGSLEETERQRDEAQRFAAFLESQGGGSLRNVFTAGLKEGDPNKAKKLELMKKILDENRMLRQSLGIALSDPNAPDDTATPAPAEATTTPLGKGSDTSKFRKEIKADVAELKQAAAELTPPPNPVVAEEAAAEEQEVAADGESAAPGINPDDEPWEVKPIADPGPGATSSGVKRISLPVSSTKAPPLERGKS